MVNKIGCLIKDRLKYLGKSQSWLAEMADVSDNAVSKWIRTGQISHKNIPIVADLLGIHAAELFPFDICPLFLQERHNIEPGLDVFSRVPLISWVQAGRWSEINKGLTLTDAEEWLPCPVNHSASTFVLRVRGESMNNPLGKPSFQDGDLIFIDPEKDAVNGSCVVVQIDDAQEATFKRLIVEGNHKYLKALNPAWPESIIELPNAAKICGVVVFKGEEL